MSKPQVVYILTRGHYSSYEIVGVEANHARAKNVKKLLGGEGYGDDIRIEKYPIGVNVDDLPRDRYRYMVIEHAPGWLAGSGKWLGTTYVEKQESTAKQEHGEVNPWPDQWNCYAVTVWAPDHEHAAKIAHDLIAQYKAREEGL